MTAIPHADLRDAMAHVATRLARRFTDIDPDVVAMTVQEEAAALSGARITEFVPLLVERRAVERLTAARRSTAAVATGAAPVTATSATWAGVLARGPGAVVGS